MGKDPVSRTNQAQPRNCKANVTSKKWLEQRLELARPDHVGSCRPAKAYILCDEKPVKSWARGRYDQICIFKRSSWVRYPRWITCGTSECNETDLEKISPVDVDQSIGMRGLSCGQILHTLCSSGYQDLFDILKLSHEYGSGNSNRGSISNWRSGMEREMGGSFKKEGICI